MPEQTSNRTGYPSPLILHLSAAALGYQSALVAAKSEDRQQFWEPELLEQVHNLPPVNDLELLRASLDRLKGFLSGLSKWQAHPYRRSVIEPQTIWRQGATRLLDYGSVNNAANPSGTPIFVVPSLINRAYILDLTENTSLLRYLATQGFRPLLLDWGEPSDAERSYNLDNYVESRLFPALAIARQLSDKPIGVLGYCMGGTLAAGVLARDREGIGAFATIGSPWDFDASKGITATIRAATNRVDGAKLIDTLGQSFGMVPTEFFQYLFALINPMQAAIKFRKFDRLKRDSREETRFVAIEDWLADGVPLATPTARDLLLDWNLENSTAKGAWKLLGDTVDITKIDVPTLGVCGTRDSITQLDVAKALPNSIPNAKVLQPDAGHVGMIVGNNAQKTVWQPISNFFRSCLE